VAEWLALLDAAGVPAGPIQNMAQLWADPQVAARAMRQVVDHPKAGPVPAIGVPVKLSATPGTVRHSAPVLGQHTAIVLREAGFDAAEIRRLHDAGVIYDAGLG
jgi:crotonobetainyl-CoA:carnitine CoA-transferase CaiB-like acyl-CoA transferase